MRTQPNFAMNGSSVFDVELYLGLRESKNPYREAFFWRYRWVAKEAKGLDVLDIPCGMGWGTSLIRNAHSLIGVDISSAAISEANRLYGKRANFRVGDMRQLDFANSSFDLISCLEGIEHVSAETGQQFLAECARILRPNGLLFLSSPYCKTGQHSGNPYHLKEYRPDELKALVSQYFHVEKSLSRDVDAVTVLYVKCRRK